MKILKNNLLVYFFPLSGIEKIFRYWEKDFKLFKHAAIHVLRDYTGSKIMSDWEIIIFQYILNDPFWN